MKPEPRPEDPLWAFEPMPHRRIYLPLGFPVEVQTNEPALLQIIDHSWPSTDDATNPVAQLKLGVSPGGSALCPPYPVPRGQGHIVSLIADTANFVVCDFRECFAYGWVTAALLAHPGYLRYCIVEGAIFNLLSAYRLTPLHAACVTVARRGFLLTGDSGAGKSTLAYACARAGFSYTSDDCSFLLRGDGSLRVLGHSRQFRFRPSARELFPELAGFDITPRAQGKPSIEIPTGQLPGIRQLPEAPIHAGILLERCEMQGATLTPLAEADAMAFMERALFPTPFMRALLRPSLERLVGLPFFTMRYQYLDAAIETLRTLAAELPA